MKVLTPRIIALLAVASILSLLLPVLPAGFVGVVIFADASVVSLLLPERLISIMARLVAAVCIVVLALSIWVNLFLFTTWDLLAGFPYLWHLLGGKGGLAVFLYGLPLFMAFALVAIEKRRHARRYETSIHSVQPHPQQG